MTDRKTSALAALTTPAAGDYLPIIDISEPLDADKNKRITVEELLRSAPSGTAAAPSIAFEGDADTGIYLPGVNQLGFSTNGVEQARIDGSGRLLVGTSSARANFFNSAIAAAIQSEGSGLGADGRFFSVTNNHTSGAQDGGGVLILSRSGGTSNGSNTIVADANRLGQISFSGSDGSEFVEGARIDALVDGTPGANDMPGRLVFSTTADASATPTERLRITSAGVLQIADAGDIAVGVTTGTKIGTATSQKIGFYNATPVVQPAAVADATDAATVITQLNDLLAKLRTLGLIAT